MANKKVKQTPLQKEYKREYNLLKRRVKSWEKTHRVLFTDIPTKPKRVTKQSIERLKNIKWKSFTEEQKRHYRTNYEEAYEENQLHNPYEYDDAYTPHTEDDFYNNNYNDHSDYWEDTGNEPAQSKEEIEAFIQETMDAILDINGIDEPNEYIRNIFETLLNNLRTSLGDKGFYEFLSDPRTVEELTEAAQTGMATSPTENTSGAEKPQAQDAILKFTSTLNRGKPLDFYQAQQLEEVVNSHGYYGGVIFEDID